MSNRDASFADRIAPAVLAQNVCIRLSEFQSCAIAAANLPIPEGFTGGFGASTAPRTNHSLVDAFPPTNVAERAASARRSFGAVSFYCVYFSIHARIHSILAM